MTCVSIAFCGGVVERHSREEYAWVDGGGWGVDAASAAKEGYAGSTGAAALSSAAAAQTTAAARKSRGGRRSRRPTTQNDVQHWRIVVFFEFVGVRLDVEIRLVDVEWE